MFLSPNGRNVRRAASLGAACLVLASACSSSSPSKVTSSPTTGESPTSSSAAGPPGVATIPSSDISPTGTFGKRPTVSVPQGSPPAQLESSDLIVGTGASAQSGQTVTVQYDGYSWTTKKEFDASWNRNQPFSFPLGQGQVIRGWDQGVVGMKVGGRRELIIPPALAYGAQSRTPAIAANDTLIFVIDLVSVGQ